MLLGCNDDPPAPDSGTKDLTVTHDINVTDQEAPEDMITIPDPDLPVGPSCQETVDCAADHYCERGEGCGMMDVPGVCLERPTDCTEEITLTCGCDGMTHDNPCLAHAAGTSVAYIGECGKEVCATDETCTAMGWWCDGGICVECSNAGIWPVRAAPVKPGGFTNATGATPANVLPKTSVAATPSALPERRAMRAPSAGIGVPPAIPAAATVTAAPLMVAPESPPWGAGPGAAPWARYARTRGVNRAPALATATAGAAPTTAVEGPASLNKLRSR